MLQGYDYDIMHIAGKANPADYLSRHNVKQEESMVQQLRLGDEEVTDEHIQDKLDQAFKRMDVSRAKAVQSECHSSLLVTLSRISLDSSMRVRIKTEYANNPWWADIVAELKSDPQNK